MTRNLSGAVSHYIHTYILAIQVTSLQSEQQQLISALSALEASLSSAQSAAHDQDVLRQRLEEAVQAKALAIMEARQVCRCLHDLCCSADGCIGVAEQPGFGIGGCLGHNTV